MYKSLVLLATLAVTLVAGGKHRHHQAAEVESAPFVMQANWNVAGTMNLIKQFEGLRLTSYQDYTGIWTIGYGHTGPEVRPGMTITQAQADAYLQGDLGKFSNCVNTYIKARLNPNQVGALISWSYNVGCGALQTSTLRQRMNAGQDPNTVARQELPQWNKAGGQVLPGLVRRRAAEVAFFTA